MSKNSGSQLKGVAAIFFVIGIISSIFIAIGAYRLTMTLTGSIFSDGNQGTSFFVALVAFAFSDFFSGCLTFVFMPLAN